MKVVGDTVTTPALEALSSFAEAKGLFLGGTKLIVELRRSKFELWETMRLLFEIGDKLLMWKVQLTLRLRIGSDEDDRELWPEQYGLTELKKLN